MLEVFFKHHDRWIPRVSLVAGNEAVGSLDHVIEIGSDHDVPRKKHLGEKVMNRIRMHERFFGVDHTWIKDFERSKSVFRDVVVQKLKKKLRANLL